MRENPGGDAQDQDEALMLRALQIAELGRGHVEPNPMVGCVIARNGVNVGEGYHQAFGGAHAEVNALHAAGAAADGATMFVTLEPCCHYGKTPPCSEAIIKAGIKRVVVAVADPFPDVSGGGLKALQAAGIQVDKGVLKAVASELLAPYLKRLLTGKPWVIAKWAMTLDGKIATRTGSSKWITGADSRAAVHHLRGVVDAVMVGRGTAVADDPLLTARPVGPRQATRIVLDSKASLSCDSQLVCTAREVPLLIAVGPEAREQACKELMKAGCEVIRCDSNSSVERLEQLLEMLAQRGMTNVLVEGGGHLLGSLFDTGNVDECHVFVAPKLVGGAAAPSPVGGAGVGLMGDALGLTRVTVRPSGVDTHIHGFPKKA